VYWHQIAYSVLMVPLRTYSLTSIARVIDSLTRYQATSHQAPWRALIREATAQCASFTAISCGVA